MRSAKDLLERARRSAPPSDFDVIDLEHRRDRRRSRQRIGATVVALVLTVAVFGTALVALRTRDETNAGSTGATGVTSPTATTGALPPATVSPLVAKVGQFYYWAVRLNAGCYPGQENFCAGVDWRLDATFWWSDDDSGRIEIDDRHNVGIDEGRFEAGLFPNGNDIDVSDFPTDPAALTSFLLARSQPDGASPAPLVTPPPDGAPEDGRMWRAITDLLADPHVTPTVRAALLDVAAGLQGSRVETDVVDPVGRPAHVIVFGNVGGHLVERLYVDPATHELLGWTKTAQIGDRPFEYFVVQSAGLASSTEAAPSESESSVPWPKGNLPDVPTAAATIEPTPAG